MDHAECRGGIGIAEGAEKAATVLGDARKVRNDTLDGVTTDTLTTFAGCPTFSPDAGGLGVITQVVATNALLARCGAPAE